jgi:hypothetical protein
LFWKGEEIIFEGKMLIEIEIPLVTCELRKCDFILMPSADLHQFKLMELTLM